MVSRSYSSERRKSSAAATRESILDAAEDLFVRQGYQSTTIANIAAKAGVAVTTVYGSVGSKSEIVIAMAVRGTNEPEIAETIRQVEDASTPREAIGLMARGVCTTIQKLLPLVTVMYDTAPFEPAVAATVTQTEEIYRANLKPLVQVLERNGWLDPRVDTNEAADIVWFHFGIPPLRMMATSGWQWPKIEAWLTDQVAYALIRQPAA
jgi:AcrR family transcriptional regulator